MRRLDQLLSDAAVRGDRMGAEWVIEHLEHRLAGEREVVVVRDELSRNARSPGALLETRRWWRQPAAAVAGFAVIVASITALVLLVGQGGEQEITQPAPIEAVQSWVAYMRADDIEAMIAASPPGQFDREFIEWQIGHQAKPEFTECRITGESTNGAFVTCDVTYSDEYFFSQLLGERATTTFSALVSPDGLVLAQDWPNPSGAALVIPDFQTWIAANHPELEDTIFGNGFAGLTFSREGAEASMQYIDEYLTYLNN